MQITACYTEKMVYYALRTTIKVEGGSRGTHLSSSCLVRVGGRHIGSSCLNAWVKSWENHERRLNTGESIYVR